MSSASTFLLGVFLFIAPVLAVDRTFEVGQQVEAFDNGWYPGAVLEIGAGKHAGDFLIRFTVSRPRWFPASRLRRFNDTAVSLHKQSGPRDGRYILHSARGGAPLALGAVDLLPGARYRVWRNGQALLGEGLYRFDSATGKVDWLTGPYAELGYHGRFLCDAAGKRHTIHLNENLAASNLEP
jgi:hypothetical protein